MEFHTRSTALVSYFATHGLGDIIADPSLLPLKSFCSGKRCLGDSYFVEGSSEGTRQYRVRGLGKARMVDLTLFHPDYVKRLDGACPYCETALFWSNKYSIITK